MVTHFSSQAACWGACGTCSWKSMACWGKQTLKIFSHIYDQGIKIILVISLGFSQYPVVHVRVTFVCLLVIVQIILWKSKVLREVKFVDAKWEFFFFTSILCVLSVRSLSMDIVTMKGRDWPTVKLTTMRWVENKLIPFFFFFFKFLT